MIDLQISHRLGKIGLDITDAQYELKQTKPVIHIDQQPAHFTLEISNPDLIIDYTQFLQSLGLGSMDFVMRSYSQAVQSEYMADLEDSVLTGRRMGAIEKKESIGEILFQATMPTERQLDIQALAPIDITYLPGSIQGHAEVGGVEMRVDYGKVSVENFSFPSVKLFMEQEPYFKIEAVGQMFDVKK